MLETVECLVENGADFLQKVNGENIIDLALDNCKDEIGDYL